ncbi:hypothetical protein [Pseudemcibacter aquimaris]|uniref:hypothetical protein n=1 Tax=Pseudemcibacter aquimaris TaxID=2857064 RepID=UPI002012EE3D|nr:hypothetical protein [Pseudemcibacter aquimaris]MCC3859853.1 hypothetical protein [Pseudemcibacter aquimaris]WDU57185.1 hypothetical protein KW060_08240 [Pseudemcibacter aquimaris]
MGREPLKTITFDEERREYNCHIFPIGIDVCHEYEELKSFYDLWNDIRGNRRLPNVQDITFETLKGWHSSVRLVEYGEDIKGPKTIKIMGEKFARLWGKESMYSKINSENPPPPDIVEKYYEYLQVIYDYNYCIGVGNVIDEEGQEQRILWIDLPLSSGDDNVTHAIGAMVMLEQDSPKLKAIA